MFLELKAMLHMLIVRDTIPLNPISHSRPFLLQTCKNLSETLTLRDLWTQRLKAMVQEQKLLLSTFAIPNMSTAELRRAVEQPLRFESRITRGGLVPSKSFAIAQSAIRRGGGLTLFRDTLVALVPGGRWLVSLAPHCLQGRKQGVLEVFDLSKALNGVELQSVASCVIPNVDDAGRLHVQVDERGVSG